MPDPGVKEFAPSQTLTDTQASFREHDVNSHAKRVVSVMPLPPVDPADNTRSLKPTSVNVAATGTGGYDLLPNATYLYIAKGETNIALATKAGVVAPDVGDLLVPANTPMHIHTGSKWRRLEIFSTPGALTWLVRVK